MYNSIQFNQCVQTKRSASVRSVLLVSVVLRVCLVVYSKSRGQIIHNPTTIAL